MANELPRELMESCCAAAQEATMQGFDDSVLSAVFGDPKHRRLLEVVYRMGFESGWRIREQQIAGGVQEPLLGVPLSTIAHATGVVMVCSDHDAACAEVPAGLRCKGCPLGVDVPEGGQSNG